MTPNEYNNSNTGFVSYITSGGNATPWDKLKYYFDRGIKQVMSMIGGARSSSVAPTTNDIASGKYAVWYNTSTASLSVYYNNDGSIIQLSSGGSITTPIKYMWIVGGSSNFASIPGSPTPPAAGASTLTDPGLANTDVRVSYNGQNLIGLNPGDGTMYYTKTSLSSTTVTFSSPISTGDQIIVETLS